MKAKIGKKLRKQLEEERERLLASSGALAASADITQWGVKVDGDPADVGVALAERASAESLASNARRLIQQIDDALARMEDGSYGRCDSCGDPIEPARLEALPYATLCLEDKQRSERISAA